MVLIYTKPTGLNTQGQPGDQPEKPVIDISSSGMVNKGVVHIMDLMCHFIKCRQIIFLEGTEFQLIFNNDCGSTVERKEELIPSRAHMCSGSRNWQKEP